VSASGDIDLECPRFTTRHADLVCYRLTIENIGNDNRRTFLGQLASVCGAYVARSAGDDSHTPAQPHRPLQEYWRNGVVQ
jgi:hypothetical protein